MKRIIKSIDNSQLDEALEFVKEVFTFSEGVESGELVKRLVKEIRSKKYYIPELELVMVDESNAIIGYALFSAYHIEERYEKELLLLSPVAVKTELQRTHISKELIEYGISEAKRLGYKACIVEGNPCNYRSRGFVTSADYGIYASDKINLPSVECLMAQELTPNALNGIHGYIDYDFYDCLK